MSSFSRHEKKSLGSVVIQDRKRMNLRLSLSAPIHSKYYVSFQTMETQLPTRPVIAAIARGALDFVPPLPEKGVHLSQTWDDGETALMTPESFAENRQWLN